ncbi:hypothetical protein ABZW30_42435 [Kitasatospora sp. NPDC004669]|uniref:hypothetical protein n=1 Tax=Kitasatospora sp. NPDC004669 TaxID=3154555 RepID=UPI0033BB9492
MPTADRPERSGELVNADHDSEAAAADLADALETFADLAATPPGTGADVWLTIGTPYEIEQRTLRLPAGVADWITELLRDETQALQADHHAASRGQDDDQGADVEPAWW